MAAVAERNTNGIADVLSITRFWASLVLAVLMVVRCFFGNLPLAWPTVTVAATGVLMGLASWMVTPKDPNSKRFDDALGVDLVFLALATLALAFSRQPWWWVWTLVVLGMAAGCYCLGVLGNQLESNTTIRVAVLGIIASVVLAIIGLPLYGTLVYHGSKVALYLTTAAPVLAYCAVVVQRLWRVITTPES